MHIFLAELRRVETTLRVCYYLAELFTKLRNQLPLLEQVKKSYSGDKCLLQGVVQRLRAMGFRVEELYYQKEREQAITLSVRVWPHQSAEWVRRVETLNRFTIYFSHGMKRVLHTILEAEHQGFCYYNYKWHSRRLFSAVVARLRHLALFVSHNRDSCIRVQWW